VTATRSAATLDGFAKATDAVEGVYLRDLEPLTRLVVRTCNSEYRIVVSPGGEMLVEGGRFFDRPTPAVLEGASLGGSFLKVGWIGVGLRMEIRDESRRIVTSPVRHIVAGGETAVVH
jgi:hypothetical protein